MTSFISLNPTFSDTGVPKLETFDDDTLGVTRVNQWSGNTPFNVRGGYTNHYDHETNRWYMDNTENAVVFVIAPVGE